ncbi:Trafficking protein particle complex subunit 8 [Trichoplax sp. H2]|nr:Trafficking protein particle complex subunit 8 [Trichoplax sp. H2]|eukprot:RDD44153.1 Trafficking protein particle complex subunit 8 [Trichoplax sp. H2]
MVSTQSAYEIIQSAFPFHIAAMCSDDAEAVCRKNNLSFVDLLRPFCKPTLEGRIKDPSNLLHVVRNPNFRIMYFSNQFVPSAMARKMMSDAVSRHPPSTESIGRAPWFDAYRDYFFQYLPLSDHEFIRNFIACMIVVSSSNPDAMEAYRKMVADQMQRQKQSSQPKWFFPSTLHYFVLIHDCANGDDQKAEALWESLRAAYGVNSCHFLKINTKQHNENDNMGNSVNVPDPWSQYMHDKLSLEPLDTSNSNILPGKQSPIIKELKRPPTLSVLGSSLSTDSEMTNSNEHLAGDQYQLDGVAADADRTKYGICLTLSDHDRLRNFIHDFIVRGLYPYLEYMLRTLYEQVNARKGLHGKFFSVTKKWFGGNKPTASTNSQSGLPEVAYAGDSHEMQMRRLADLAFLLQHYDLAYTFYHSAKKEFNTDHAWLQFAGVAEMAAVSNFMLNSAQKPYPMHYMESAIGTYLSTCKLPLYATRCTFLSTEIMKAKGLNNDAAQAYIRVTSEDFDLRSSLLLEQAAYCFNLAKPPMKRKCAFHLILAGHRFSKSGQRTHALSCYKLALQTYKKKAWHLAEDHINFTIGRHSYTLRDLSNALEAFRSLFNHKCLQPANQQNLFLREFLNVYKQYLTQVEKYNEFNSLVPDVQAPPTRAPLPILPLPIIIQNSTRVLLTNSKEECITQGDRKDETDIVRASSVTLTQRFDPLRAKSWASLEEAVVFGKTKRDKHSLANFRPSIQLFSSKTNNSYKPAAVVGEYIVVEIVVKNPLKISLFLGDVTLIWRHISKTDSDTFGENKIISNENTTEYDNFVESEVIDSFVLAQNEEKSIQLYIRPLKIGELEISAITYRLSNYSFALDSSGKRMTGSVGVCGKQELRPVGNRLNNTENERFNVVYATDNRLHLNVVAPAPLLEVSFCNFPSRLLCGEIQQVTVELYNTGSGPLHNLYVASSYPELFSFSDDKPDNWSENDTVYSKVPVIKYHTRHNKAKKITNVIAVPLPESKLVSGCSVKLPLWIIGSAIPGVQEIDFLFYYEPLEPHPRLGYRILKHVSLVSISSSLNITACACNTYQGDTENELGVSDRIDLNQAIVSLNIENLYQLQRVKSTMLSFRIMQVSSVSPHWTIYPIQPYHKDITVTPKEKVLLCFKARNSNPGFIDDEDCQDIQVLFSNISLKDDIELDSLSTPCSDFFFRSGCWYALMPNINKPSVKSFNQNEKLLAGTGSRRMSKKFDIRLGLVIIWESDIEVDGIRRTITGQHHVPVTTIIPLNDDKDKPKQEAVNQKEPEKRKRIATGSMEKPKPGSKPPGRPPLPAHLAPSTPPSVKSADEFRKRMVKYKLRHPSSVYHDFHNKRLCIIPVTLILQNCRDEPLDIFINLAKAKDKTSTKSKSEENLNTIIGDAATAFGLTASFTWVGNTAYKRRLEAKDQICLSLMASFCVCNVYNLNELQVYAALHRDECEDTKKIRSNMVEQYPCADSYIVLNSTKQDSFELDDTIYDIADDTNDED